MKNLNKKIDIFLTVFCSLIIIVIGVALANNPGNAIALVDNLMWSILNTFTSEYLWLELIVLVVTVAFACSKYGSIRLGPEKPQFSKLSVFFMFFCAGYGAAMFYWGYLETAFYFTAPPFGVEPGSDMAYQWAIAYNQFHWGPSAYCTAAFCAVAVCYSLYVKKNNNLQLGSIVGTCINKPLAKPVSKVMEIIYIFATLGSVTMSVTLSLPLISKAFAALVGIQHTIAINIAILAVISVVFCVSSYVGLEKGMSKISDANVYLFMVFIVIMFFAGDKLFSIDMLTNGLGLMANNYVRMSLWTDPVVRGGFPNGWTVFYWAYWAIFAPFTAVFIAKLAKGHKLRDVVFIVLGGGSLGSWLCHGFMQTYTLNLHRTGAMDLFKALQGDTDLVVLDIVKSLPLPTVCLVIMVVCGILFTATTVDGCSFSIAAATARKLRADATPSPMLKLFWCIVISITPVVLMAIKAPLNTIKAIPTMLSLPLLIIVCIMGFGSLHQYKKMYGNMSRKDIEEENRRMVAEYEANQAAEKA